MSQSRRSTVRAVARGLDVLKALNRLNGATCNKIAAVTGMPRATAHRILLTLETEGYAVRESRNGLYRVTALVRGLGDGYEEEAWIADIAAKPIKELGRRVQWPLGLSTLYGTQLLVRETTDADSLLALKRYSSGHRLSLLTTASGRVFMAYTSVATRQALLDILRQSGQPRDRLAHETKAFDRILAEVKAKGFAHSSAPVEGESAIAVPVLSGERLLATLALRYIDSALSKRQVIERYLAPLQSTAGEIAAGFKAAAHRSAKADQHMTRSR